MHWFDMAIITLIVFLGCQKICDKLDEMREPLMCIKVSE